MKSDFINDVYLEHWRTPIMHNQQLWLQFVLHTGSTVHFFFSVNDKAESIHVMTINCGWPYRVVDESLGYHCIGKYFRFKKEPLKKVKICSTWKVWNTSFILDMESANALSGYAKKRNKDYFEYVIATQDEYIEFISLNPPSWEFYQDIEIQKLINDYTEKSLVEKSRSREYQKKGGNSALEKDFEKLSGKTLKTLDDMEYKIISKDSRVVKRLRTRIKAATLEIQPIDVKKELRVKVRH